MVGSCMVEHLVRAFVSHEFAAAFGARRADDAKSRGTRELHGGDADASAGAVDQHRFTPASVRSSGRARETR